MTDHVHDTHVDPVPAVPVFTPSVAPTRRNRGPIALEREADRVAEAFLAGAGGLAAGLTRTEAASVEVTGSVGRPLDPVVRGRLEHGFGADLGRVRVHADAAAQRFTAEEHAEALTAGPDIFFGPHSFHPDTDEGMRLLVHEVAHALQQTGRASTGNRRRVTDARGRGPLQANDPFLDRFTPAGRPAATAANRWNAVREDHGADQTGSPVEAFATGLGRTLGGQIDPSDPRFTDLARSVVRGEHGASSVQERSFLLDVLKVGLAWEAAASLIEDSEDVLHTAGLSTTFQEWLVVGGRPISWGGQIVQRVEALRTYRDYMYGAFRIFLVRPDQRPYRVPNERVTAMYAPATWTADLVPNERIALAAGRLMFLDEMRFQMCREVDEFSGVNVRTDDEFERQFIANPVFRAQRRLQQLAPRLEAWRTAADQSGEVLLQRAAAWFTERHLAATQFWDAAVRQWIADRERRGSAGRMEVSDERRAELARALAANPVVSRSAQRVSRALVAFLRPETTSVGTTAQHRTRIDALVRVIDAELGTVLADLSGFRLDEPTRARADLVPWLMLRLESLRQSLRSYTPDTDTDRYDDARELHRLRLAIDARIFALEISDSTLESAALAVQQNLSGAQTRLVLATNWTHPERSDLTKLSEDFPNGLSVADGITITPQALRFFYDELYMNRLATSIETLLGAGPGAADTLVLQEASRAADAAPQPVRWTVERSAWEPHPHEDRPISFFVASHPKTRDQLPVESATMQLTFPRWWTEVTADMAHARELPGEIFMWELPAWDRLAFEVATALHEIEFLADEIGPVVAPLDWIAAAQRLMSSPDGPTRAAVRFRIAEHLYERSLTQRRRLGTNGMPPGLLRSATNHDRVVVARMIRQVLEPYDGTVSGWELPSRALDLIEQFHRYAAPAADNVPQTAALVVEVAAALRRAFVREAFWGHVVMEEDRYDIVTGYYGFLVFGEQWLTDAERRLRLTRDFVRLSEPQLSQALTDLREVHAAFDRVRARIQRDHGFEVSGGGLRSLHYPFIVTADQEFGTDGSVIRFTRIFRAFRYHPPYGFRGNTLDGVEGGARSEAMVIDPVSGDPITPGTDLIEIRVNDRPYVIKAPILDVARRDQRSETDLEALDFLWRAVEDQAFVLSMQNLQEVIEGTFELALDAAEFIPGAGQALMVGRIVASVAAFLASADFDDIKAALSGEVIEQIEHLITEITDLMSPDQLWMFLLFDLDTDILDRLRQRNSSSARARRVARRRSGKFAKIMRGLMRLGTLFVLQLEKMHDRVQPPLRNTQAFVVSHPVVGMVVDLAADAVVWLSEQPNLTELAGDLADFDGDMQRTFRARIEGLVEGIEGFELPHDLIPLDLLVSAILSLILERFGRKAKVIEKVLSVTGAMDQIGAMVADELRSIGADPNEIWVARVKPLVDGVLNSARADLLDGMRSALGMFGLADAIPANRTIATVDDPDGLEVSGGAEPAFSIGRGGMLDDVVTTGGDVIPPGPGTPLPARVRTSAERDLGHQFGHVRLHQRAVGDGIDAIARGSHVVMRPGLSLDGGRGAEVLRHELGHVVRNTGGSNRPTKGRPGTGVRFDPASERQADLLGSAPGGDADVAAPALSPAILSNVLRRIASYSDLREFQSDIHGTVTDLPELSSEQGTQIERFKDKLVAALRSATLPVSGVPSAPGAVHDKVRHHASLAGDKMRELARGDHNGVERLARRALHEVPQRRRAGTVQPREYRLAPSDLRRLTEGYLLVRTGLICEVVLPRGLAAFEAAMSASAPIEVRVTGLFLGAVTKSSQLWQMLLGPGGQLALHTTHHGARPADSTVTRNSVTIATVEQQNALFQSLVAYMRAVGPRRRVLERTRFAILEELIAAAVDRLSMGSEVPSDQLPRPSAYLDATPGSSHGRISSGAEVALRIGTHGRLTTSGTSTFSTLDRESHHTTQYLFAEYFTNRVSGLHPFLADDPGVELSGSRPDKLHRADGRAPIQVGPLHGPEGQRGNPMPAILLASLTHQRGNLHVHRSPPDDGPGNAHSNQSNTVDGWFRTKAARTRPPESAAPSGTTPSTVASMPEPAKRRNADLVAGVEDVYHRMRALMLSALERGLIEYEKPYYESIAARRRDRLDENEDLKEEWQLDVGDLGRVFRAARRNNDDVMEHFGLRAGAG